MADQRMIVDVAPDAAVWNGVDEGVQALLDSWLVSEGSHVEAGQALARVVLVKASLEVVAPCAGMLEKVLVAAGENFARGQPLGQLRPD
jgi:pyruvate/2-oxoglutarate dehydrogenase complex dihydrolipoamide acyltransferase (E2) component